MTVLRIVYDVTASAVIGALIAINFLGVGYLLLLRQPSTQPGVTFRGTRSPRRLRS
jgi:hypothetical protein